MRRLLAAAVLAGCCRVGATDVSISRDALEKERIAALDRAGAGYTATVATPPFVVVAYGPADVREEAVQTIAEAAARLRTTLFDREPDRPITVWVWPDEESYMRGSSAVLGSIPDTPYGFFLPCKCALVVNAGYGWGTLVHEVVHAYMDADFPEAPVWVQEGIATLYEKSQWRLPSLQSELVRAPSFHRMAKAGRSEFTGKEGYLYYATAGYLFHWLKERGLLERFYREHRRRKGDGIDVLHDVTGSEISDLRTSWEAFVRSSIVSAR